MERRITTIILLVLLGITTVCAQQPKQVSGTVYSAAGHVLVGASVTGGGHTVVTNGDGYFVLKTDAELTSITVSHVGYRAQRVKLSPAQNEPLRVYLKTATIQLQEVLVMSANARELVAAAISKIPKN